MYPLPVVWHVLEVRIRGYAHAGRLQNASSHKMHAAAQSAEHVRQAPTSTFSSTKMKKQEGETKFRGELRPEEEEEATK